MQPFAQQGKIINLNESGSVPDFWHFKLNGSLSAITVGNCRKAYDLLKPVVADNQKNIKECETEIISEISYLNNEIPITDFEDKSFDKENQ